MCQRRFGSGNQDRIHYDVAETVLPKDFCHRYCCVGRRQHAGLYGHRRLVGDYLFQLLAQHIWINIHLCGYAGGVLGCNRCYCRAGIYAESLSRLYVGLDSSAA